MLKKFKIVLFLFLLLVFVLDVTTTYSKYTSEAIGEVKTNIAKWQILVNDNDITSNYTSTIDFSPVIEENVNVAANTMAPQSKGYFDIEINPENVGTSFTYTIELLPLENSDITDIVITDYATIDENTDLNNITKKAYNNRTITNNVLYDNTTTNFKHKPFRIRLYFCWKDDATNTMDDNADTIIGEKAANGEEINFKISASISFNQYIS